MPVDPAIALGVRPVEAPDAMGMFGKYVGLSNATQQNKLLGIAEQRGQIGIQQDQQSLDQARQTQALQAYGHVQDQLAALSANPNTTPQDIAHRAQMLESVGVVPKGFADTVIKDIPTDQAAVQPWLAQQRANIAATRGNLQQQLYGSPQLFNNGAQQQVATVNPDPGMPGAGVRPVAGGLFQNQLSPETLSTPTQTGITPQGAPIMGTRGQFLGAATGGTPSPLGDGRLPAALRNPAAAGGAQPGGGVVTGQGPAQQAQQQAAGLAGNAAFQSIADQGVQAQSRGAILDNMLGDTSQFSTGPGADAIARVRQVAGRLGLPVDTNATSAAESFNKLAAQIASAQQGANSDSRMAVAQAANPHSSLSPGGVDLILRQLRGNEDYLMARRDLAAKWGDKANSPAFEAQVGKNLDPRVFQVDRMTGPQKKTFFHSLPDADKAKFVQAYDWTKANLGGQ